MNTEVPRRILPVIVIAQFATTSLWFAGNAILPGLQRDMGYPAESLAAITTAVQLGFIVGTLLFAYFAVSDRWSPRRVFLACALLGAGCNFTVLIAGPSLAPMLLLRFLTGFFLAGIYPVGMKIASSWFGRDLGRALGFLVGALVLGTAVPHLFVHSLDWKSVMIAVSVLSAVGGCLMYVFVPDGPRLRASARFDPMALAKIFSRPEFRASSFGYFGHMWELYALWAFLPVYVAAYLGNEASAATTSLWTFAVIGAGALGCAIGGMISIRYGSARVAAVCLFLSGLCCLLSPLAFFMPQWAMIAFLLLWGLAVVGDSPQFSALNAQYAPQQWVGSALTIVNCVGFAITILSIQLLQWLLPLTDVRYVFLFLLPGPVFGLLALSRLLREPAGRAETG